MNDELQDKLDELFEDSRIVTWLEVQSVFCEAQQLIWTYPVRAAETVIVDMSIDPDPDRILDLTMWGLHIFCDANDCVGWADNGLKLAGAPGNCLNVQYLYQKYIEYCSKLFEQDWLEINIYEDEVPWETLNAELHLYCSKVDYVLGTGFNEIVYAQKKVRADELYQEIIVGFDPAMFEAHALN